MNRREGRAAGAAAGLLLDFHLGFLEIFYGAKEKKEKFKSDTHTQFFSKLSSSACSPYLRQVVTF